MDYLPKLVVLVALIWYIILIIESRTVSAALVRLRVRNDAAHARGIVKRHAADAADVVVETAITAADALKNGPTIIAANIIKHEAVVVAEELKNNPGGTL